MAKLSKGGEPWERRCGGGCAQNEPEVLPEPESRGGAALVRNERGLEGRLDPRAPGSRARAGPGPEAAPAADATADGLAAQAARASFEKCVLASPFLGFILIPEIYLEISVIVKGEYRNWAFVKGG